MYLVFTCIPGESLWVTQVFVVVLVCIFSTNELPCVLTHILPLKHHLTCVLLCYSPDSGPCCNDTCMFKPADSEICQEESECKEQAKCRYPFALSSQSV